MHFMTYHHDKKIFSVGSQRGHDNYHMERPLQGKYETMTLFKCHGKDYNFIKCRLSD